MKHMFLFLLVLLTCLPARAANEPELLFPVDCVFGLDCWILHYMDVERKINMARDFECHERTYDTYNGTAIALMDKFSIEEGFPVLAAADGTVLGTITGGNGYNENNPCGNGVVIEHKRNWRTRYCHLKQDSISVSIGQDVKKGETLGLVGMTGKTDWPMLHFDVMHNDNFIDPFTGRTNYMGCGLKPRPLWENPEKYPYQPFAVFKAGFVAGVPDIGKIEGGFPRLIGMPVNTPALALYGQIYGSESGDRIDLTVLDPQGREFLNLNGTIEEKLDRRFVYAIKTRDNEIWEPGLYVGTITISRFENGKEVKDVRTTSIKLR